MYSLTKMYRTMHTTTKKVEYMVTLSKREVPASTTYWLYHVLVERADHNNIGFQVIATKQSFSSEDLADLLAMGPALDNVKGLLEHVTVEGKPLLYPLVSEEGWVVF